MDAALDGMQLSGWDDASGVSPAVSASAADGQSASAAASSGGGPSTEPWLQPLPAGDTSSLEGWPDAGCDPCAFSPPDSMHVGGSEGLDQLLGDQVGSGFEMPARALSWQLNVPQTRPGD